MDIRTDSSLLAYPEPAEAECDRGGRAAAETYGSAAPAGRRGESIRGVRELLPADPVSDIHWKASAKAGNWMVKERERDAAKVADLRIPFPCPPTEIEHIVSRACFSVLRCEKEGRPYRIFAGDDLRVDASGGSRRAEALTFLALVGPDGACA
jgi:uncharacterized protein (DUF58 family)